jgi:anaerobic magnesium-protoporphyrin IX monomethyl ester cyclase
MYYREGDAICSPPGLDMVEDLDSLPFPAWDLPDLPAYSRIQNMNGWRKGKRYSAIFTSRGCPYSCGYCHDIFGRKVRWRSPENVLAEIDLLRSRYGVDEFQIFDDIFNLDKERMRKIFHGVADRYGEDRPYFCFPNGLRGDLLDEEDVAALRRGGTYQVTVAVETASPRLQTLIKKRVDLEKVTEAIRLCNEAGILVRAFFMLGLPTETPDEIKQTIRFARRSKLALASFFTFVPQPKTPLYDLARAECAEAVDGLDRGDYFGPGWYELAHGYPLSRVITRAYLAFFLTPSRFFKLARNLGWRRVLDGGRMMLELVRALNFPGRALAKSSAAGPGAKS